MDNNTCPQFPRTEVGGVSLPRMIIGTNWLLGYSHTTSAADCLITGTHTRDSIAAVFATFLKYGVDAVMGPLSTNPLVFDAIRAAEDKTGKKLIMVDTPIINVDDSKEARAEAENLIKISAAKGSTFCMPHHASVEQLVNKNKGAIPRLPDYLAMIRGNGMIPGLSAHMPEIVVYSDANNYDVETYIQIFNCMGFLMQVEIEHIANVIQNAKKPVMTIKPFAAGRVTPYVGFTFSWNAIRERDMITVGCFNPVEAEEDVLLSLSILERRYADIGRRGSLASGQAAFNK